jgi:hypothetical protein
MSAYSQHLSSTATQEAIGGTYHNCAANGKLGCGLILAMQYQPTSHAAQAVWGIHDLMLLLNQPAYTN